MWPALISGTILSKAYFDENGRWIKTETELLSSELPSVMVKTVVGAYKGNSIFKVAEG